MLEGEGMRIKKRSILITFILLMIGFFMVTYDLPYYVYKPGQVDDLKQIVEVDGAYPSVGDFHLVTVSGGQASPVQYVAAKILPYHELTPIEEARPHGISDDEYMHYQYMLMENSHHSATVVAYEAAGKKVDIEFDGVYVMSVVEDMPADGVVEMGDRIYEVDGTKIKEANELVRYVQEKDAGDTIEITIDRDGKTLTKSIEVAPFPDDKKKVGIGIQLVTDQKITAEPKAEIKSGNIGGPSAGLMFALELYNRLTEEDITKGYHVAGTGELDFDGGVHRIGGIDKKVVAAHRRGIEIFFAPNENGDEDSNYEQAKEVAEHIETPMEIVPVDTFFDALDYLKQLEPVTNAR